MRACVYLCLCLFVYIYVCAYVYVGVCPLAPSLGEFWQGSLSRIENIPMEGYSHQCWVGLRGSKAGLVNKDVSE